MAKSYSDLVAQAASAVSAIKDPELKRVAFEKVLDDLLADATGPPPAADQSTGKRKTVSPGKKTSSGSASRHGGPFAYITELIEDKFFAKVKTMGEVKAELENRGHHIPFTSLSGPLQRLCQKKQLRRQKMDRGGKKTFGYSNW
jgi:membrane protein involved in colicin uptake